MEEKLAERFIAPAITYGVTREAPYNEKNAIDKFQVNKSVESDESSGRRARAITRGPTATNSAYKNTTVNIKP